MSFSENEDADEVWILNNYNDEQELLPIRQEKHGSLMLAHECTSGISIPHPSQKDTLELYETKAHKDILEIPECITYENILKGLQQTSDNRSPESLIHGCLSPHGSSWLPLANRHNGSPAESDGSSSGSSLFRTQCTFTPTRKARSRSQGTPSQKPSSGMSYKDSPDSSSEPVTRFNLKKIFEQRRKRRLRRERKNEIREISKKPSKTALQPHESIPFARHQRRWKDEECQFPFLAKKDLTLRMIFAHEQASIWGFLHQMKRMKYDRHLQTSLKNLNVCKESKDQDMEERRYSYVDDEGPISPIAESNEDPNCDDSELPEEYDAKIVPL
ncbi:TATA box-binding protein-associated factor RNA polymerase I subunit D isoform X2 [Ambystoma mexicanum]|uniref:TATA box-binding protein-associated factor RNA polymerase I subunit D isoform X2 n=1 Tax=Ambystoma mexicanum TaxID=8296 RepID=UPI0037E7A25A